MQSDLQIEPGFQNTRHTHALACLSNRAWRRLVGYGVEGCGLGSLHCNVSVEESVGGEAEAYPHSNKAA
jgi:hypothetical protein